MLVFAYTSTRAYFPKILFINQFIREICILRDGPFFFALVFSNFPASYSRAPERGQVVQNTTELIWSTILCSSQAMRHFWGSSLSLVWQQNLSSRKIQYKQDKSSREWNFSEPNNRRQVLMSLQNIHKEDVAFLKYLYTQLWVRLFILHPSSAYRKGQAHSRRIFFGSGNNCMMIIFHPVWDSMRDHGCSGKCWGITAYLWKSLSFY